MAKSERFVALSVIQAFGYVGLQECLEIRRIVEVSLTEDSHSSCINHAVLQNRMSKVIRIIRMTGLWIMT